MSLILSLMLFGLAPAATSPLPPTPPTTALEDPKIEYERRLELAKGDVQKLWVLHNFCVLNNLKREDRKVLRELLKLDPDHQEAHEAAGHIFYDEQWFTSKKKYETYKAKKEEEEAQAKGWVRYKGKWTDPAEVEKLEAGLVKDEDGNWLTPEELKYKTEGWIQFDLDWISPDEQPNIEKGLFKCGDKWMTESDANQYHRIPARFWRIPSDDGRFIIYTTLDRAQALEALTLAEQAVPDLKRLFGRTPDHPVVFAVLRSNEQYGRFAAGDRAFGTRETEVRGLSSLYGAYFADGWFDDELNHMGAGVAYWDHDAKAGDQFGKLYVRNAAGLSFVEGIDPSPAEVAKLKKTKKFNVKAFIAQKKLPQWLHYGAAAYVEKYRIVQGVGFEPLSLRRWAISNVEKRGGLDGVSTILRMKLSIDRRPESEKLVNEAGLIVAYILDGDNEAVKAKHEAFKSAFTSGKPFDVELKDLEAALKEAAADIRRFARK
jgi:hypothetical protein